MPSLSERNALLEALYREAKQIGTAVVRPNHPLLLSPPELLVASSPLLFAVFVPTRVEADSPWKLEARVALCRLALPMPLRVLVVARADLEDLRVHARFFADGVVDVQSSLATVVRDLSDGGRPDHDERQLPAREAALVRMAAILPREDGDDEARSVPRAQGVTILESETHQDASSPRGLEFSRRVVTGELRRRLKSAVLQSISVDFAVDNGVLYLRGTASLPVHEVVAPAIRATRSSTGHHLMTAAAFAGWDIGGMPRETGR